MSSNDDSDKETQATGSLIGSYRIGRSIGSGAMANVVEAIDSRSGERVALKVLDARLAERSDVVARFVREGRALEHLQHPNIVRVIEHGVCPTGEAWIAMELLEGQSLAAIMKAETRLHPIRAVRIALHVARGLAAVHEWGIVHRDVKPENIFVVAQNAEHPEIAKLIDFGIAKITAAELGAGSVQYTRMGSLLGSTAFAPPEQLSGQKVEASADVFALAATLYEALSGQLPFDGLTIHEQVKAKVAGAVVPLEKRAPDATFPRSLTALLARALSREPARRPQDGRAMVQELEAVFAELLVESRTMKMLSVPPKALAMLRAGGEAAAFPVGMGALPPLTHGTRTSGARNTIWFFVAVLVVLGIAGAVLVAWSFGAHR